MQIKFMADFISEGRNVLEQQRENILVIDLGCWSSPVALYR